MTRKDKHQAGKQTIALIGMRGSGKTTVGRILAERLAGSFVDTDELVVLHAGKTIAQIFAQESEVGFRRREAHAIRLAAETSPTVLSVGGGALLNAENCEILRRNSFVVWLSAPAPVLWQRVAADAHSGDGRPPLTDHDPREELSRLLAAREPLFAQAADLRIDTTDCSPGDVVERLLCGLADMD